VTELKKKKDFPENRKLKLPSCEARVFKSYALFLLQPFTSFQMSCQQTTDNCGVENGKTARLERSSFPNQL
jgi:hypothetical protein